MSRFFKPYEGARPFLFVSYAHRQSEAVVDTIRILHEKGFRLWYDEGIPAGSDWPANIAQHMHSCERVLFFLSERAMESANCFSEVRTAARLGKPILIVRLEDAPIDARWQELLVGREEIPLLGSAQERADAILRSGFVSRRFRHNVWEKIPWRALGLAASLLLFLGAGGALGALAAGLWTLPQPEPAVVVTPEPTSAPTPVPTLDLGGAEQYFAVNFGGSTQIERAIRRALGKEAGDNVYRWEIAQIEALYFCGNMTLKGTERIRFGEDGVCRVNGAPVVMGKISDLRLLSYASSLRELALICQPLDGLDELNGHELLRELSLAGSPVDGLERLGDLPALEILHLEHTEASDLTALEQLPALRTVTVSRGMLPLRWNDGAFHVILTPDGK